MRRIYLDANGSCPAFERARQKVQECLGLIGNPSSFHAHGQAMGALIHEARHDIARGAGALPKELIFTSGASEANRLFVDSLKARGAPFKVLMSPFEHPSLLKPVLAAAEAGHFSVTVMELDADGRLAIPDDLALFDAVICTQAHNETGILPDIDALLAGLAEHTLFMSDISQSYGRLAPPGARADVLTFSAQKMGGFAGSGALILRGRAKSLPHPWQGGGQERGIRPGTEASLLIAAFGSAARDVLESRRMHGDLKALRDDFEAELSKRARIKVVGQSLPRLPNTSAITFLGQDPDALRIGCDMAGLSVGFGSACSGLAPEGSLAMKRLGLSLLEEKCTVRFSMAAGTTAQDLEEAIERLCSAVLA